MKAVAALSAARTAILIHGAGGGSWEWQKWEPVFALRGWKTHAVHLIPSPAGLEATTVKDYSRQVEQAVSNVSTSKIALIGASMGGLLAMLAASSLGADAAVLINTVTPQGFKTSTQYPPVVKWANKPIQGTIDALPDCSDDMIQTAWKSWRDESGAVMNELAAGCTVSPLPTCPSLVVIGSQDTDIEPESNLALAKQLSADVHLYSDTSHVGPLLGERAAEIAQAAESWLSIRMKD